MTITDVKPFEVEYKLEILGACCGTEYLFYESMDDLILDEDNQNGSVTMSVKEDCGHWDEKVRWELHTIEFYEIAEYLDEWGVDTLDSDRFIVYTDGTWTRGDMLKILEYKRGK